MFIFTIFQLLLLKRKLRSNVAQDLGKRNWRQNGSNRQVYYIYTVYYIYGYYIYTVCLIAFLRCLERWKTLSQIEYTDTLYDFVFIKTWLITEMYLHDFNYICAKNNADFKLLFHSFFYDLWHTGCIRWSQPYKDTMSPTIIFCYVVVNSFKLLSQVELIFPLLLRQLKSKVIVIQFLKVLYLTTCLQSMQNKMLTRLCNG